jgi:uncharacterized membrane protein
MRYEHEILIQASPQRVWEVFSDVQRWPEWMPTITAVERLDDGPLRVGSRTRIRQPRLPVAVWEVTELEDGRQFTWVSRGPGVRTTGSHRVTTTPDGTVAVSSIDQDGPLGQLLGLLLRNLTNRYLRLEGESLKERSEGP